MDNEFDALFLPTIDCSDRFLLAAARFMYSHNQCTMTPVDLHLLLMTDVGGTVDMTRTFLQ